ncbi:MAG: sugar phosphate isomerase/epimerase [Armatimonadetes bacterium]|nr:sugar phosphate isomerase/epimerase [Armatimonadota bacterium]
MKLGFVSAILADLALDDVLRVAADEGYDCVEVMAWPKGKAERRYAGVTHIDVATLTPNEADRINDLCDDLGVCLSGLGYYVNPLSPDPDESATCVEHLGRVIDGAQMLGLSVVNTFIGRDQHKSVDDNWPRLLEVWKPLVARAESKGVRLAIENCPMAFTNDEWPGGKNIATTPAIWRRLFASLPSDYLGLNFDPSHFVWQQMDYLKPLREFSAKLFHVHAKDCRVERHRLDDVGIMVNPLAFHTPKLPGLGEVDWSRFFSELSDSGFDGAVCVEVEDRAYEGTLQTRVQALRQSAGYLRGYLARA